MHSFKIAASLALLASLVVAAPKNFIEKRATGPATTDEDFINAIVDTHNAHRRYHQVGDLKWNQKMANFAEKTANKCIFDHSGGPYGENLFGIWPGYDNFTQGTIDGVKSWVYEVKAYNYKKPGYDPNTGHFTQAVWKGTTEVGCSWNTIPCKGAAFLFCEYNPGGNIIGYFPENVFGPGW